MKLCPFCKSSPSLLYQSGDETRSQSWQMICKNSDCGASTQTFWGSNSWYTNKAADDEAKFNAIRVWETRA